MERVDRAIEIIKLLKHTGGQYAGHNFKLTDNQAFVLGSLFGWVNKTNGYRRFTKVYLEVARKWGKSEFCAALQVIMSLFDGEYGAQIVTAATKLPQCNFVFNAVQEMMRRLKEDEPELNSFIKIRKFDIEIKETNTIIKRITADGNTEDGANIHFATVDEYHAHADTKVLKVIETGTVSRTQPCTFIITTAGFNKYGPCFKTRDVVKRILKGDVENDRFFGLIFTLDEGDDWKDPKNWPKANPNMPITPLPSNMKDAFTKAITEGSEAMVEFKTKNLNIWVDAADTWITDEQWDNCKTDVVLNDYKGKEVILGLDISSGVDLTSLAITLPKQEGVENPLIFTEHFCPSAKIKSRGVTDGVDYKEWAKKGYIHVTKGNVISYDYIIARILQIHEDFKIQVLEFDPWGAKHIIPKLEKAGIYCDPHPPGFKNISLPTKAFKRMVLKHPKNSIEAPDIEVDSLINEDLQEGGKLINIQRDQNNEDNLEVEKIDYYFLHDGNPVTAWMIRNAEVEYDPAGNQKIVKSSNTRGRSKHYNKVDGVVAMIMSISGILYPVEDDSGSTYDENDLLIL